MKRTIYQPTGRAREYSPLALNLYSSCVHGCGYCYASRLARMRGEDNYYSVASPRPGLLEDLRAFLVKNTVTEQVLLSFIGDCYAETTDGNQLTHDVVRLLANNGVPFAVLTKSANVLSDLDVFRSAPSVMVGMTLTFDDEEKSKQEEPYAAIPSERIGTLRALHEAGVKTFASFEPVIEPEESLAIMRKALPYVDLFKVGRLNGDKRAASVDWEQFLRKSLSILRAAGKEIYVKEDLRNSAKNVILTADEQDADLHCVRPLEAATLFD